MRLLPKTWWKLCFHWFFELNNRSPEARRGLFRNSLKVSVFGLSLAIASLSLVKAIVRGFESQLASGISSSLGEMVYFSKWHSFRDWKTMLASSPNLSAVKNIESVWTTQGLVVGSKGGRGVMIEGRHSLDLDALNTEMNESSADENSKVKIQIGKPLAELLGVTTGGSIKVLLPGVIKAPVESIVTGLIDHGMYSVDSRLVIVDDASLRAHIKAKDPKSWSDRPGDAHGLRFYFHDPYVGVTGEKKLQAWKQAFANHLTKTGFENEEPTLRSWRDQRSNLFGAVEHEQGMLSMVFALLTLVAALNIAATLVVLFLERDRDMAILQAVGMPRNFFIQWICLQGLFMGALAVGFGLILARVLGWILLKMPFAQLPADIYNISQIPLLYSGRDQLWAVCFGIVSSFIVALGLGWSLSRVRLMGVLGQRR